LTKAGSLSYSLSRQTILVSKNYVRTIAVISNPAPVRLQQLNRTKSLNQNHSIFGNKLKVCDNLYLFPTLQVRFYAGGNQTTVKVPSMGDSITEGRILEWTKQVGEQCNENDVVLAIETDKIRFDVRAPGAGAITKTLVNIGDDVRVGQDLFVFETGASGAKEASKEAPKEEKPKEKSAAAPAPEKSEAKAPQQEKPAAAPAQEKPKAPQQDKPAAAPSQEKAKSPTPTGAVSSDFKLGSREERKVKISKMRQRIVARLKESQNTAAMLPPFKKLICTT